MKKREEKTYGYSNSLELVKRHTNLLTKFKKSLHSYYTNHTKHKNLIVTIKRKENPIFSTSTSYLIKMLQFAILNFM